jgi:protein O-mannosyl-transferase
MMQEEFSPTRARPETSGHGGNQNSISNNASPAEWQSHPRWLTAAICLVLAAMVWVVFGQTRHFEFINYDDPHYVYDNPVFNQGLKWHAIVWSFTHQNEHEWFPVTYVTRMLDFQLYGANAGGHHLTNVLLHMATAILLFLLLRRMTGRLWSAAFVAAVFAIHPLRVESVAWVVERKDVLSGLFFMLTLWAWMDYVENRPAFQKTGLHQEMANVAIDPRRWIFSYCLALFFSALGLLSKSMLVTLPCVMLLLDFWPLKRLPSGGLAAVRSEFHAWLGLILEKIPFLALSAASSVTTALTETNVVSAAHHFSIFWRIGNYLLAYTVYLKHTVYPVGLALVYPYSETNPSIWSVGFAALILLLISMIAMAGRRKHPYLLAGWLWYVGMFLPVILTMQATQNARADRYTYLPQIGLLILMTWGAVEFSSNWRRRRLVLGSAAAVILACLLAGAYVQTTYWKDSVSIWTRSVACTSENYFAENCLGSALNNQGKWDEAVQHLQRSLQFKPDNIQTHVNLGIALSNQGKTEEAISQFEQTLRLNPHSIEAHYYLADALASQDKLEEAIPHYEQALQFRPDYSDNNFNYTDAHYGLGLALASQHKWAEAVPHFEQALHLKLDETDARYILAVKLAARKKWDKAIELCQQVLQRKPDFAEAHNNYGIALASTGKSTEAAQQFQEALALATAQGNTALAESIRSQLKSLQSAMPQSKSP